MSQPRLGGKRAIVLELDWLPATGALTSVVTMEDVAKTLRLDRVETAYLAQYLRGVSQVDMPHALHRDRMECERLRKRIERRVEQRRFAHAPISTVDDRFESSVRMSYERTLPGGGRVWELTKLPDGFAAIMRAEKKYLQKLS